MGISDIVKSSIMKEFAHSDISSAKILVILGVCFLISTYIYFVYRYVCKNTFYNKNFNVSMAIISVIVAGIVVAMQSNLVISLGMVGALSIVRFRTAIKEPMDLLFLFWSIGTGIMCGARLYELAVIVALVVTIGLLFLQIIPITVSPYLIIINANDKAVAGDIETVIKKYSPKYRVDSKNIRQTGMDLIIEVRTKEENLLVDSLSEIEGVSSVSLLYHDGPVKN